MNRIALEAYLRSRSEEMSLWAMVQWQWDWKVWINQTDVKKEGSWLSP